MLKLVIRCHSIELFRKIHKNMTRLAEPNAVPTTFPIQYRNWKRFGSKYLPAIRCHSHNIYWYTTNLNSGPFYTKFHNFSQF